MSGDVRRSQGMSGDVGRCQEMSGDVRRSHEMLGDVGKSIVEIIRRLYCKECEEKICMVHGFTMLSFLFETFDLAFLNYSDCSILFRNFFQFFSHFAKLSVTSIVTIQLKTCLYNLNDKLHRKYTEIFLM